MVDLLSQQGAIRTGTGDTLERSGSFDQIRKTYPPFDSKLIQLIHKAATNLRELQSPDMVETPDSQQELSEFNEDKQTLCGANP